MDSTDSRFAPSPDTASDDVASPFNPPAFDRQDLLDFEPVPLRHRTGGLTPERQRAYVEALADTGLVREAAARVGVSEQAIARVRRRLDAVDFDRACEAAHMFGARRLRSIAFERAIEGSLKGHYYHGELVSQERVYDNRLLVYLLGKTEHLLEPPEDTTAICANWEPHMDALEQGLPPPEPDELEDIADQLVWQKDDGAWRTSYPPPEGFDGFEDGVYDGKGWYCRSLSAEEQAVIDSREAEEQAQDHARRDRFFGFPGGRNSSPREAETTETTEPSGEEHRGQGAIEYKSLVPPSFRRRPESMNTEARDSSRQCSWIPDRGRDEGTARHPGESRPPTSKPPSPGILADEPPGAVA
jgi:hypothetical protein